MPPEPIEVIVAEFKDATEHHVLEIAPIAGVQFGADGDAVHGAVVVKDGAGTVLGLWIPAPAPPPQP